ncbi:MAG: Fur family transcriptional regulator [Alphaproteobacteria bacterium]|nr:Fur family transcriptional regulator [Alphaproteobacteria bacterium]
MQETFQGSFADPEHDHTHCITGALASAETVCRVRGARLTGQRRRVLEIIWKSHVPMGAYEILAALSPEERPAAPPTVYRALDFLQAHGLVHKIETLKAYVGCQHPGEDHVGQFLICQGCGAAAEIEDPEIARAVEGRANAAGFQIAEMTLEVRGLCPTCVDDSPRQ